MAYYALVELLVSKDQGYEPGEQVLLPDDHPDIPELLARELITDRAPRRRNRVKNEDNAEKE